MAEGPAAPPEAVEPRTEGPGIQLTPGGAALLSTASTLLGGTASLLWLSRGEPNVVPALGLLGVVLVTAPGAGRSPPAPKESS